MKFYNPFKVQERRNSLKDSVSLALLITVGFVNGLIFYPVIGFTIISALVVSRVLYAIIKGD